MKIQFEIFKANFNYLATIAIEEYEKNKTKENLKKTSLLWHLWSYTSMLLTEYNFLEENYINKYNEVLKENIKLKKQLDEIHNTTGLKNLRESRYIKKNAE